MIPLEGLPAWIRPLAVAAREVGVADVARFAPPPDGGGPESAVLIALTWTHDGGPSVQLIQRAADRRTHAGQVAFPGGA
ncbi:MAG: hypothetical protein QOH14_403, partial [Pseudonocardiales bacterium]|nr:hypothetical protein [Pseudonocardiales bacterium]